MSPSFPAALVCLALTLSACSRLDTYDDKAGLTRQDYEDLAGRRGRPPAQQAEPPIPALQPVLAAPTPPSLALGRRVSVAVTEETPLRDLLLELARKADIDLELDPGIQGGIIFAAQDRPLEQVVGRIADLAGLRYTFKDNVLRVERDLPFTRTYRIDALNLVRTMSGEISTTTDVFSAVASTTSAGGGNASSSTISNSSTADLWEEVNVAITQILTNAGPTRLVVASAAPTAPTAAATPNPTQLAQAVSQAIAAASAGQDTPPSPEQIAQATQQAIAAQQAATAVGTPVAPPAAPVIPGLPGATGETGVPAEAAASFSLNRQSGLVTIHASQRQHRLVEDYLDRLRRQYGTQVLIEAKIVEVALRDQFRAGINWSRLADVNDSLVLSLPLGTGIVTAPALPTLTLGHAIRGLDINGVLTLLDQFGTVRTLSSPRLTVTNNNAAVLKVAENEVYFTIEIESNTTDGVTTTTFSSEVNTVPIGVVMTVQPSISAETGEVTMSLRPTISRVVRRVADPAVSLQNQAVESLIPVVEVREMDSIITINSGEVVVMGGLMQERSQNDEQRTPLLGDIPLLGQAFRQDLRDSQVTELVIFLRATIVNDRETIFPADRALYRRFAPDPRPLTF